MTPVLPQSRTLRGIFSLPTAPARSRRVEFIDLLRGWAVIVMIHAHALNATLRPDLTTAPLYHVLDFINGLVAPAFLFGAGLVFGITSQRKLKDYLAFRWPLVRQVSRLLLLLLIGYLLHIPKFDLQHLLHEAGPLAWQHFYQVDTLHCIAVSLLLLLAVLLIFRSQERAFAAVSVLTVLVVVTTPLVWSVDFWQILPLPLAEYFNGLHNSLFPLFPWSAFIFAGASAGFYFIRVREQCSEETGMKRAMTVLALTGVLLFAFSFPLDAVAAKIYPVYDYWHTSPSFFMLRLGLVLLLLYGFSLYERKRSVSPRSLVTLIGRESFLIYTAHLMLIYGNFGSGSFEQHVAHQYGYLGAWTTFVVLMAIMIIVALFWSSTRLMRPELRRTLEVGVAAISVLIFLLGF